MKPENKQRAEIVGVIAVVISLLFVAYQIQQANRIAFATAEIELRNNYASLNETVLNNRELSEIFLKLEQNPTDINDLDRTILRAWVFRLFNIFETVESAYDNGLASEITYQNMLSDIRGNLRTAEMRRLFSENITDYAAGQEWDFVQYMQEILADFEE